MRILLFGRNGQVARCLAEEGAASHEIIALGSAEADLTRAGAALEAIESHQPEIIINAAAYTAVDKAEDDRDAARMLNESAPADMAKASAQAGIPFLHLSTDYVFDGQEALSYAEDKPANPLNVYGATKRKGEELVLAADPEAVIIRTSWVFSEFGGNFVKTMLRLGAERDALKIVDDQIGGPTPARDIARMLLSVAGKKHRGASGAGLYHFQGAPAVSWADFAIEIFNIAGLTVEVEKLPTSAYPTAAQRPLQTVLDCSRIERDFGVSQPDWQLGLRQVIEVLSKT